MHYGAVQYSGDKKVKEVRIVVDTPFFIYTDPSTSAALVVRRGYPKG